MAHPPFAEQVGLIVEHAPRLAILKAVHRKEGEDAILDYTNRILTKATLAPLSQGDLRRAIRTLKGAGLISAEGEHLVLTAAGQKALDLLVNGSSLTPPPPVRRR